MPRTISTAEAENQFGSVLTWVEEHNDEVIVESQGRPRAIIMSVAGYEEVSALKERVRREALIKRVRQLRAEVTSRNRDLTEDEAMAIADRFSHEIVEDMVREGKIVFERDV